MNIKFSKFLTKVIPDSIYVRLLFLKHYKRLPNLRNPQTFGEKLQWLKLYDRQPEYTMLVDKVLVKEYIKDKIGEQYIIPTLGVWENPEDIDFDSLPKQFVLKWNHDSGSTIIVKDKANLDIPATVSKLKHYREHNGYYYGREWPYKNVKPLVFAEKYMEDEVYHELRDYKWFCFDGKPKVMFIATDRYKENTDVKFDFFDTDKKWLNIKNVHENAKTPPQLPEFFDEMKALAECLSKGMAHVRVDFFECNGKVYFGELTLTHGSGLLPLEPETWEYTFGSWLTLPKVTKNT